MKLKIKQPPRTFKPRGDDLIIISDFGNVFMEENELLTFISSNNKRFDMVKRNWGTSTSSINHRLKNEGFKTALVKNLSGMRYIMAVDIDKMSDFECYCEQEEQVVEYWIDEMD